MSKQDQPNNTDSPSAGFLNGLGSVAHIAHRGGGGLYPENTLFAFRGASTSHQTDIIETDVHLSADGEVVVFHDDTLERTTNGRGAVASKPWSRLQGLDAGHFFSRDGGQTFPFRGLGIGIPRLVDALRALPEMRFNIELKGANPALAEAVRDIVRSEQACERVCLGREDDTAASYLCELLPEVTHFFPREALTSWVTGVLMGTPVVPDARYTILELPPTFGGMDLITEAVVAQARADGLSLYVWTIDDADEMRRLIALGVTGIMTDHPDILREVLSSN